METPQIEVDKFVVKTLAKAITYGNFRDEISRKVINYVPHPEGKKPDYEFYEKLNHQRMERLDKSIIVDQQIKSEIQEIVKDEQVWLVLTEGWCGDGAQSLPVINKMAEANDKITLRIAYRDKNHQLMDQFLTNGARSIPKLIILDGQNFEVVGTWGPRPNEAKKLRESLIANNETMLDIATELQKWYTKDKGATIQAEIMELLKQINISNR